MSFTHITQVCVCAVLLVCMVDVSVAYNCPSGCPAGQQCVADGVCFGMEVATGGGTGMSCNPACSDGKQCLFGSCVELNIDIGGSGSGSGGGSIQIPDIFGGCSPACSSSQLCLAGSCLNIDGDLFSGVDWSNIHNCTFSSDCAGTGMPQCVQGFCVPALPYSSCSAKQKCLDGGDCTNGLCMGTFTPDYNCAKANNNFGCYSGTRCSFGNCVPLIEGQDASCNNCNTENGDVCLPNSFGTCVPNPTTSAPECSPTCASGSECVRSPFGAPYCRSQGSSCTADSDCTGSNKCALTPANVKQCVPLPALSALGGSGNRPDVQRALAGAGIDLSGYNGTVPAANLTNYILSGVLNAVAGTILQISNSILNGGNVVLPAFPSQSGNGASALALQSTALLIDVDDVTTGAIRANSAVSTIALPGQRNLIADLLELGADAVTSISLIGQADAEQSNSVEFKRLNLTGKALNVLGAAGDVFRFPAAASDVSASNGAIIRVAGNLGLTGNTGAAPISVTRGASTLDLSPTFTVPAAGELVVGGPLSGDADSNVVVRGTLTYSGRFIQPAVRLENGGQFKVSVSVSNGVSAGNVSLAGTGANKLVINAASVSAGEQISFANLLACTSTSRITYNVAGTVASALASKTATAIFKYGHATPRTSMVCTVEVCGTDGCTELYNRNTETATARRRLLEASTGANAVWSTDGLYFQATDGNSAAQLTMYMPAITILMMAAIALIRHIY